MRLRSLLLLPGSATLASLCFGQIVPPNVVAVREVSDPPAIQNGERWETAFVNPQQAFAAVAAPGATRNEIWVAAGTYRPTATTDRNVSFVLVPGTRFYGGFAGNETAFSQRPSPLAPTILSGDLDANPANRVTDSLHVVRIEDRGIHWIDGFTIEYGAAIPASGSPVPGSPDNWGGGLLAYDPAGEIEIDTRVEVRDVTFRNCIAGAGGGAAFGTGVDRVAISRCNFVNNIGFSRDPSFDIGFLGVGGGLAVWNIGGTRVLGAQGDQQIIEGVYVYHSNFENNIATWGGAVVASGTRENIWFVNNRLYQNTAYGGGAFFEYESSASLPQGWPRIEFCTMAANTATASLGGAGLSYFGGGAVHGHQNTPANSSIRVRSSILWGNSESTSSGNGAESIGGSAAGTVSVNFSDVQVTVTPAPWPAGTGNLNIDPLFVSLGTGNVRLGFSSPCIDAADDSVLDRNPAIGLGDLLDVDRNGIFGGIGGQHLPIDLDLTVQREFDAPTTDTGQDAAVPIWIADMGCYEYVLGNPGAQ